MNAEHKTTVRTLYPLDFGMMNLMQKENFLKLLYFKTTEKSFRANEIQELKAENYKIFEEIMQLRDKNVQQKIFRVMQKIEFSAKNYFLIFGTERVFKNKRKKKLKEIVFVYIPGLPFLPGLSYSKFKNIKKKKAS